MTAAPADPRNAAAAGAPAARAALELRAGNVRLRMRAAVSPAALLAVGGLVSSILLSTSVLVWTAASVRRRHPIASALAR